MPILRIPVLALAVIVFTLIVVATSRKMSLGLSAVFGGLLFALLRGVGLAEIARSVIAELFDADTILLLLLVASIMALSNAMRKSGALAAFARAVAFIAPSPRISMTLTPLLIGTLPMPGGAIVSAPLVDALDPERRQGPAGLTAINYWFRHSLELAWPLYPAFILTCAISGLEAPRLILINIYAPIVLILLGQLFVIRGDVLAEEARDVAGERPRSSATREKSAGSLRDLHGFLPIAILLAVYVVLDIACRGLLPRFGLPKGTATIIARYVPAISGVAVASLYVILRSGGVEAFRGALNLSVARLIGIVAGIRVFSALLGAGGLAERGAAELASWGIPAILVAVILPFVSALVTGVGFAYVGIAMPIVAGLFPAGGPFPLEAAIVLAGAFGFAGMMLSPLHVCFIVSAEHFGSRLAPVVRRIALPLFLFLAICSTYAILLAKVL